MYPFFFPAGQLFSYADSSGPSRRNDWFSKLADQVSFLADDENAWHLCGEYRHMVYRRDDTDFVAQATALAGSAARYSELKGIFGAESCGAKYVKDVGLVLNAAGRDRQSYSLSIKCRVADFTCVVRVPNWGALPASSTAGGAPNFRSANRPVVLSHPADREGFKLDAEFVVAAQSFFFAGRMVMAYLAGTIQEESLKKHGMTKWAYVEYLRGAGYGSVSEWSTYASMVQWGTRAPLDEKHTRDGYQHSDQYYEFSHNLMLGIQQTRALRTLKRRLTNSPSQVAALKQVKIKNGAGWRGLKEKANKTHGMFAGFLKHFESLIERN